MNDPRRLAAELYNRMLAAQCDAGEVAREVLARAAELDHDLLDHDLLDHDLAAVREFVERAA